VFERGPGADEGLLYGVVGAGRTDLSFDGFKVGGTNSRRSLSALFGYLGHLR
jgi:hypothetical protein